MLFALSVCGQTQSRFQIISLNQNARTFVNSETGWVLADLDTPIDSGTVFKNYSDPVSRILIRDWEKNMQYNIILEQEEFPLALALAAKTKDSNGKMLPYFAKAIVDAQKPTLFNSRSATAVSQRSTSYNSAQHKLALSVYAGLVCSDGKFHVDSVASVSSYPVGCRRHKDGSFILTNYTDDKDLYFTLLTYTRVAGGAIKVTAVLPDYFVMLEPQSETLIPSDGATGDQTVLIATEDRIDPYVMALRLERAENTKVESKTPRSSGAAFCR